MKNNLVFNIPTFTEDYSTFPKPINANYDYWVPLLEHFITKSNAIEIHCWNEEIETIKEIKTLYGNEIGVRNSLYLMLRTKKLYLSKV